MAVWSTDSQQLHHSLCLALHHLQLTPGSLQLYFDRHSILHAIVIGRHRGMGRKHSLTLGYYMEHST